MALNRPLDTIGGCDIGPIMGVSTFSSGIDVYRRVVDAHESFQGNAATELGEALEEPTILMYIEANKLAGRRLSVKPAPIMPNRPKWARGSPDALFSRSVSDPTIAIGLEAKSAILSNCSEWGKEGTDVIPQSYLLQVAWYTWYYDLPQWDIAAILNYRGFQQFRYIRNMDLENTIVNRVTEFWNKCQMRILPDPDGSSGFTDYLNIKPKADVLPAPDAVQEVGLEYLKLKERMKADEKELERKKQLLLQASGGATLKGIGWTMRVKPGKKSTAWAGVAKEMGAPPELIAKHSGVSEKPSIEVRETNE
jgi:predicted phage-related endonuclease